MKLTDNGKTNAAIVTPKTKSTTLEFASKELQTFIYKITGAKLPIQHIPAQDGKINIFLGRNFAQNDYPHDLDFLKESDGFAVRHSGNNIYIFGTQPKGTLNGVYTFLDRNTDIIWARGKEFGTMYTEKPTLTVKDVDFREKPAFNLRGWHICCIWRHSHLLTERWMVRNRCNWVGSSNLKELLPRRLKHGFSLEYGGGHNLRKYLPNDTYFKSHPEYYAMLDGKRRPISSQSQLCFTNPEMTEEFTKSLLDKIEKNPEFKFFNVLTEDNWNVCECPECTKPITLPDGTLLPVTDDSFRSTQFFIFLNKVAAKVHEKYPDKLINAYAYIFTAIPPKVKLFPTICLKFCPFVKNDKLAVTAPGNKKWQDRVEEWKKMDGKLVWREYYGCASGFPRPLANAAAKDLIFIKKLGMDKVYSEYIPDSDKKYKGHPLSWCWDVSAMEFWVLSNLFWDPNQNVDNLRKKYITRTFHKAAPFIEQYYKIIREAWYNDPAPSYYNDSAEKNASYYIFRKGHENGCRKQLSKAAKAAIDPRVKQLVQCIQNRFEYWMTEAKKNKAPELCIPFIADASKASFNITSNPWPKAAVVDDFKIMGKPAQKAKYKSIIKLMHDRKNLYLFFKFTDPKPDKIYSLPYSKEEKWTKGDHCEIFIDGDQKAKGSYYQLAFDSNANIYDAVGYNKKWDGNWKVKTQVTEDGWQALATIPLKTIGVNISMGNKVNATFYRMTSHQSKTESEHSSWNGAAVHQPAGFGELTLNME